MKTFYRKHGTLKTVLSVLFVLSLLFVGIRIIAYPAVNTMNTQMGDNKLDTLKVGNNSNKISATMRDTVLTHVNTIYTAIQSMKNLETRIRGLDGRI
jgi:hypothetical protein